MLKVFATCRCGAAVLLEEPHSSDPYLILRSPKNVLHGECQCGVAHVVWYTTNSFPLQPIPDQGRKSQGAHVPSSRI